MTIDEWESREEEDDHFLVDVMEHKTTGTFGPASVAVSQDIATIMNFILGEKSLLSVPHMQRGFFLPILVTSSQRSVKG